MGFTQEKMGILGDLDGCSWESGNHGLPGWEMEVLPSTNRDGMVIEW